MAFFAYNLSIHSDFDLNLPLIDAKIDLWITKADFKVPIGQPTKIHRFGLQALFKSTSDTCFLIWPGLADFRITETTIEYKTSRKLPEGLLRILILSEALGTVLFLRGCFLLHASAVLVQNQAKVFLGKPGAGKSSMIAAFAKHGFTVLSDDLVAIQLTEGIVPQVIPSFPEIKIWKDTADQLGLYSGTLLPAWEGKNKFLLPTPTLPLNPTAYPLNQILIIQKQKSNTSELEHAAIELLKYFPLADQLLDSHGLQQHFLAATKIGSTIPLITLERPEGFANLEKYVMRFLSDL